MTKLKISIYDLQRFSNSVETVHTYLADNSCGDPDCCGEPWTSEEDYQDALDTLSRLGLELEIDHTIRD